MKVYVGQTRSAALIAELREYGWGEMTQPREIPPRRYPFVLDNAAFTAWRQGKPWDAQRFIDACLHLYREGIAPDFVVVPDQVARGNESLSFSLAWAPWLRGFAPLYLAVQDGMTFAHVYSVIDQFDGLFVGGSLEWKLETSPGWVGLAHWANRPCHIGRVSGYARTKWARVIGADSIDSCVPLFSSENRRAFKRGLYEPLAG